MTKREEFFLALMEEPSVSKAYKRAGISRSRAYQFLNDESIQRRFKACEAGDFKLCDRLFAEQSI